MPQPWYTLITRSICHLKERSINKYFKVTVFKRKHLKETVMGKLLSSQRTPLETLSYKKTSPSIYLLIFFLHNDYQKITGKYIWCEWLRKVSKHQNQQIISILPRKISKTGLKKTSELRGRLVSYGNRKLFRPH